MGTLGELNIVLSASADMFQAGLKKAREEMSGLAEFASGVGESVMSALESPMALLGIGLGGAGMAEYLRSTMETTEQTVRLGEETGVAVDQLNGLQHAAKMAGLSAEDLETGLEHMQRAMGMAQMSGSPVAAVLDHIGLNAKKLAAEKPDQAMMDIAEGLKNVQSQSDRSVAAFEIFGRSGQRLLPMLMEGREGLQHFVDEAKKLNPSLNEVDAAKIVAANHAVENLQELVQGAATTVVAQLSPFLQAAADKLVSMGTSGKTASGWIVDGFGFVLEGIAKTTDYLAAAEAAFYMLEFAGAKADSTLVKGIAAVLDGLDYLLKKVGEAPSGWGDSMRDMGQYLDQFADDAFQKSGEKWDDFMKGRNSAAASAWMTDLKGRASELAEANDKLAKSMGHVGDPDGPAGDYIKNFEKAQEVLKSLKEQVATFGMDEGQKKLFELQQANASPEQLSQARAMAEQLEHLQAVKKAHEEAMSEAKKLWEETRTPLEKYNEQLEKLNDLLKQHAIDQETFQRAAQKAQEELDKANEKRGREDRHQGAAAETASVAYTIPAMTDNGPQQQELQVGKEQLIEQKKQSKSFDDLLNLFSNVSVLTLMEIV